MAETPPVNPDAEQPLPEWLVAVITRPLNRFQAKAVASWARDVKERGVQGPQSSVEGSELLRHLNLGNMQVAAAEFTKWCLISGRVSNKALHNRQMEQNFFGKQVYTPSI